MRTLHGYSNDFVKSIEEFRDQGNTMCILMSEIFGIAANSEFKSYFLDIDDRDQFIFDMADYFNYKAIFE